ncbi:MAG: rhomboid family intramembrane serine protease [Thermoplasmatota archaeon]
MTAFLSGDHSWVLFIMVLASAILSVLLPWLKKATATNVLSASIILIFVAQFVMTSDIFSSLPLVGESIHVSRDVLFRDLGFRPASIVDDIEIHQFLTSMFLHNDFLHVMMNFLGLFILGTQLEHKIGWKRFLILYYGSGIIAGAVVLSISPFDVLGHSMTSVSIGASGCIFGLLGGFWYLYPREEIYFPLIILKKWPISLIILLYGGFSALMILVRSDDEVSHVAHFAGMVGAIPIAFLIKPKSEEAEEVVKKLHASSEELMALTTGKKQKEILNKALKADEEDVRDAWLEEFFSRINCPKCGGKGMHYEGKDAICPKCGKRLRP